MSQHSIIEMGDLMNNDKHLLLLQANKENKLQNLQLILSEGGDAEKVNPKTQLSFFETVCQTPGSKQLILRCIENGCDINKKNDELKKYPINFCIDSLDVENLSTLLTYKPNVNVQVESLTPVHQLCNCLTEANFSSVFECIKLLIKYDADVNIPDHLSVTPILSLAKSKVMGAETIIQYLIENASPDLDTFRNGEARKMLMIKYPKIVLPPPSVHNKNDKVKQIDYNFLSSLLHEENEDDFITKYEYRLSNADHSSNQILLEDADNLLQIAVEKGLFNSIKTIVSKETYKFNANTASWSPLEIACLHGNYEVLDFLLKHSNIPLKHREPLMSIVVKKLGDESTKYKICNYHKCFQILLNDSRIDINEIDSLDCTALHYAVRYKNDNATRELLKRGACIGTKNRFNDYPISDINPLVLEEYFDSCIQTNDLRPGDENYEIIFDYVSLVPLQPNMKPSRNYCKHAEEMPPLDYLSKSQDLRYLIMHPLITSFLWLKWQRLSLIFYTNFIIHSFFCVSMISYLVFCYGRDTSKTVATILYVISTLGLIYLVIRELFQLLMLSVNYFKLTGSYIEIALICCTYIVLSAAEFEESKRRTLASISILLTAIEFSVLVGTLPFMSISTHMVMLKTVSISFVRSLVLYSIIIISFALCFYTLLSSSETLDGAPVDIELNNFNDPWISIVKTIVMFTGEFDASSINFQTNNITYFVFLLFVFFISIVLLNLLNGLAVSDTAAIKSQSALTGFIYRIDQLTRYEKMILGRTQSDCNDILFRNGMINRFFGNLISIFPTFLPMYKLILKPNQNSKVYTIVPTIEEGTCNDSKNAKQVPLTLRKSLIFCCLCNNKCTNMHGKTLRNAIKILENKSRRIEEKKEKNAVQNRLETMEHSITSIQEMLATILLKLDNNKEKM